MELKELIHPLEVLEVVGNTDVEISGKFLLFRMKTYRYPKANRFLSG